VHNLLMMAQANTTPRRASLLRGRAGFTLTEVMIALVMTAVIGGAVTSVFINQASFYDRQEKTDFARGVSRSAINILTSELRMIERDSGVVEASSNRLVLRVPYVLGVSCGGVGTVMSLRYAPTDTVVLKDTVYSGFARLRDDGTWQYHDIAVNGSTLPSLGVGGTVCNGVTDTVRAIPNGGTMQLSVPSAGDVAPRGRPVLLYQRITYEFKASTAVPGRIGLYRTINRNGLEEELVAPFTANAAFRFFINDAVTASVTPPSNLKELTGIQLVMEAASERPDRNGSYPTVPLTTSVFFKNRLQ
jgi:prepilin-type N-terminal cleavage/methylation domain-containing protein